MKANLNLILVILLISCSLGSRLRQRRRRLTEITLTFVSSSNLAYDTINSKWKFDITYKKDQTAPSVGVTYSVSILRGDTAGSALCTVANATLLNCEVQGDNQVRSELIRINNVKTDGNEVTWKSLSEVYGIPMNVELTFIKAYDLKFSNNDWQFKIQVSGGDNYPENTAVLVDVNSFQSNTFTYNKVCLLNNNILSCSGGKDTTSQSYLLRVLTQKTDKSTGTVTWKNAKQKNYDIYLNYNFDNFYFAYGGFFTDKYHFMIKAKYPSTKCPLDALVIVDILQNGEATTATCSLLEQPGLTAITGTLHCISDKETQRYDDVIKISSTKTSGTVTWTTGLTDDNNVVQEFTSVSEETIVTIVQQKFEAKDMYFSNNRWFFNIFGYVSNVNSLEEKRYQVDIKVKKPGDNGEINGNAYCFLYMFNGNQNLRFICYCDYENQSKDDLIKIAYKTADGSPTIKWKSAFTSDYPIILNTDLDFSNVNNFVKQSNKYTFDITLKEDSGAILPVNSELVVDCIDQSKSTWYVADCIANSKTLLSCTITFNYDSNRIRLTYAKSLSSSVLWRNTNSEDYTTLSSLGEPETRTSSGSSSETASPAPLKLELVKSYNLAFGADSKWTFDINYAIWYASPSAAATFTTSILYADSNALATCTLESSKLLLHCTVDKDSQQKSDLIKINNVKNDATITWKNLNEPLDIPINATLNYYESYDFVSDSSSKISTFEIQLLESDVLPTYGKVIIDIIYSDSKHALSECTYNNHKLTCKLNQIISIDTYVHKVSKTRTAGSITWNYLDKDKVIPISSIVTNYWSSKNLDFVDGQWKYKIKVRITGISHSGELITINSKIKKKSGNEMIYFTRCYYLGDDTYECTVFGDNQEKSDLVSLTPETTNSINSKISTNWNGQLKSDEIISRKAELSLIKLYDLESISNGGWSFKIDVSDDEDMPENAIVEVAVKGFDISTQTLSSTYKESTCTFKEHVLSCFGVYFSNSNYLPRLQTEQMLTYKGSVTWKNTKQLHYDIPFNYTFSEFKRAYGQFFTDKNHFLIVGTYKNSCPLEAKVIVDIIHNNVETTATCTLNEKNSGIEGSMHCISDYETQTANDIIKINTEKKYGSITWEKPPTTENNEVSVYESVVEKTQIVITYKEHFEAKDMYFSNGKWFFSIKAGSNTELDNKRYKVDIIVSRANNEIPLETTAYCFLYKINSNIKLRFICYCNYENQNKDDLIKLAYKEADGSDSIKWKSAFTTDQAITLNTELTFKKIDNFEKSGNYYGFKVTLANDPDYILPINSKVVMDLINTYDYHWPGADCTVTTKTKLTCISKDTYSSQQYIGLPYSKSLDASVTWQNENREDYKTFSSNAQDKPNPENTDSSSQTSTNTESSSTSSNTDPVKSSPIEDKPTQNEENSSNYIIDAKLYLLFALILL